MKQKGLARPQLSRHRNLLFLIVGLSVLLTSGWAPEVEARCYWKGTRVQVGSFFGLFPKWQWQPFWYCEPVPVVSKVPKVNVGSNETVDVGQSINFNASFTDGDNDGPYSYTWMFGDGNSATDTVSETGDIPLNYAYTQTGEFTATLEVIDSAGNKGSQQRTIKVLPISDDTCDEQRVSIRSTAPLGMWNMPSTWDKNRLPNANDWVMIQSSNLVILPNAAINVKGLCIEQDGILQSAFNNLLSAPSVTNISAGAIRNQGTIQSAPGINSGIINDEYKHATAGSNIFITTGRLVNEITGKITANGRGGDDLPYKVYQAGSSDINAMGGHGGSIDIQTEVFINQGTVEGGHGGDGDTFDSWSKFVYGNAYGGKGGTVSINAANLAMSMNAPTGKIKAGNGGLADGIYRWLQLNLVYGRWGLMGWWWNGGKMYDVVGGNGGQVSVNLGKISGVVQGSKGKETKRTLYYPTVIWWEPTTMTVDEATRINNADEIVIFGGNDWVMDLRKLSPGAIQADKTITLAVGKDSVVDLRGLSDKAFIASEKVDIFADSVLLDEGVMLEDVFDAPVINQQPSKILYHVELGYQKHVIGEPNTSLPIKLNILNNGPTQDTYTVEVESREGWKVSQLPQQVTVNGLRRTELNLRINLPETRGLEDELTITVTSQGDPTQQAVAHIKVGVEELEAITPRNGQKADISIVLDNSFSMVGYFQVIADALEQMLVQKTVSGASDEDVKTYFEQMSEDNPPTQEAFQAFLDQFKEEEESEMPAPVIEFITFTDDVISRVVTDNLPEVIGRIRSLQPKDGGDCPNVSVNALNSALENLNLTGQIILATAASPHQDTTAVTQKLYDKGIKTHVLLGGSCEDETSEKLLYQTLAENTGGTFHWLPQGSLSDTALAETITTVVTQSLTPRQPEGDLKAFGVIKDKFGQPLEGAIVRISQRITATNDEGRWEMDGLAEGQYTLTANKSDYPVVTRTFELGNEQNERLSFRLASALDVKVKPHTRDNIPQGQKLVYTVTIVNHGENTATGAQLQEIVPEGTTLVSMKPLEGGQCNPTTKTCQLPDLLSGGSTQVDIVINNDQAGTLFNNVVVTTNEYPDDIQVTKAEITPYLSVKLADTPDPIVMESVLHYQAIVELSDLAPKATANDVKLFLRLPEGTELSSIDTDYGVCDISQYPKIACELEDLSIAAPGDISQMTVDMDVQLTDATLLLLTSEASVSASNYPTHTIKEQTKVVVPPEAMADISIVMDTTHSMHEEVNGTMKALEAFIKQQINANTNPVVNLIEFKDNVTLRAFTSNLQHIVDAIHQFEVKDGGLCQEASAEALSLAVDHTVPGGTIVFVTDAAPYENADLDALGKRLKAKKIKLTVLISGDCTTSSGKQSWNDVQ